MQKGEADVSKNAPADILPTHFLSHCSLTQQEDQLAFFFFLAGGRGGGVLFFIMANAMQL